MTISAYLKEVDTWINSTGVRYFNELTNMTLLTEEVGELARLMARTYGEQSWKSGPPANVQAQIADEISDIVFVLACMSNQMGVELESALLENLKKKSSRDHIRHMQNTKLK